MTHFLVEDKFCFSSNCAGPPFNAVSVTPPWVDHTPFKYLPRRKGLVPEVVVGLSTGPGEEVVVVGWNCWEQVQVCAVEILEGPKEQWNKKKKIM